MPTQKKIEVVEELIEKLKKAKSLVLADYHGLTHKQLEDLRKSLEEAEADFIVVKNTLLKKAVEKADLSADLDKEEIFQGPNALLLAYQDELIPLKKVAQYIKQFQLPELKFGLFSKKLLTKGELIALSSLPSKEVLLGKLVGGLESPLIRFNMALKWNLQKLVLALKAVENAKTRS